MSCLFWERGPSRCSGSLESHAHVAPAPHDAFLLVVDGHHHVDVHLFIEEDKPDDAHLLVQHDEALDPLHALEVAFVVMDDRVGRYDLHQLLGRLLGPHSARSDQEEGVEQVLQGISPCIWHLSSKTPECSADECQGLR